MLVGSKVDYDISKLDIPKDDKGDNNYKKSFSATLTIIVRDKDGKVIKKYKQKSHSPTANFIGIMLPITYYNIVNSCWTLKTTSNSAISYGLSITSNCSYITYPNNGFSHPVYIENILVGSGSQSNSYNAYNLNAPISNGSGTGQLIYSTLSTPTSITINGNEAYFIISQSLTNQSGATITISEVGIIINIEITQINNTVNGSGSILTWYDVLSSPISVGNGQSVVFIILLV